MGDKPSVESDALVWNKILIPKHRFVLWIATHRKLLNRDRLMKIGVHCDGVNNVLCDIQILESDAHLFLECTITLYLWRSVADLSGFNITLSDVPNTIKSIQQRHWKWFKKDVVAASYGAMVYNIWHARNVKMFRRQVVSVSHILQQIQITVRERIDMFSASKRARKCAGFLAMVCK
ncbi:hypothetical protein P3S68_014875 [Capsicum galapagoense]